MVTIAQVQRGFAKFVDVHVAAAYSGIEKALVLGGTTLIAANMPKLVEQYAAHPAVALLGVYQKENGLIDLEAVYNAFVPHMGTEKLPIPLPKLGSINLGTLKLGKEELDILMKYIKEA
jgi:hypothetical protein